MSKLWLKPVCGFVFVMIMVFAVSAFAQDEPWYEDEHSHDVYLDPTVAPLVVPTVEDFTSELSETDSADKSILANSGVSSYFEVGSTQKIGLLTPYYRYSKALAFKVRLPLIWNRTLDYGTEERSASGLGDITLESEYSRFMHAWNGLLRMQLSLKLPTGNDEPDEVDNFYEPALGTGTLDVIARGIFSRATPTYGYVASLLYRQNSSSEESYTNDYGAGPITDTYTYTQASQIVASAFYRYLLQPRVWLHVGASVLLLGDGEEKYTSTGPTPPSTTSLNQGGTLIDIYPGISYQMGPINPFIGVRIPVSTSYDNEFAGTDRDMAFIVQFTYQPDKIGG